MFWGFKKHYANLGKPSIGCSIVYGHHNLTPLFVPVPQTPPENVTGNNLTAYSMRVQWDGLAVKPAGIVRKWILYYRVWNATLDTTLNISVPVTQKHRIIEGLELFTLYCIQVLSYIHD